MLKHDYAFHDKVIKKSWTSTNETKDNYLIIY